MDSSNYKLITTAGELGAAVEELSKHQAIGFDTETTSLDPYNGRLRLLQLSAPDGVRIIDLYRFTTGDLKRSEALEPLRKLLSALRPVKIAHNAKFDAKWTRHVLGVELGGLFDTLLASQIISAGDQEERHGLEAVAARYLNETIDKAERLSDWDGELSEAQLQYAAMDASILLPLREKMIERLKADALLRCAALEFDCVLPVACIELAGIYLDEHRWREQLVSVERKRETLARELQDMLSEESMQGSLFGPPTRDEINLDSHTQLTKALKRLGVPVPDSTRNWKLQPLAAEYEVVRKLLDYRTVQKALTSYGENILQEISPVTGRIHADFRQIGAPTGRMACLVGETLISTPHGFKRIDAICAGDIVKTSYGPKRVQAAWMNGVKAVYKVTLKDGREIKATADHLFLTGKGDTWKPVSELSAGDEVFVSLKVGEASTSLESPALNIDADHVNHRKEVKLPGVLSVELCELMGLILADGYLGKRHVRSARRRLLKEGDPAEYDRIYIACGYQDQDLIERIIRYGQDLFGVPFIEMKSHTCRLLCLASTKVAEFLAQLGLSGSAHTKIIPEAILSAPPMYHAALLRGLFEGDGHKGMQVISLCSVNLALLRQAQLLLSNLGIYSQIKKRNDISGFAGHPRFNLLVHGKRNLEKFMCQVGFISTRKNAPFNFHPDQRDGVLTPFILKASDLYREAVTAGLLERKGKNVQAFATQYKRRFVRDETASWLIAQYGALPSLLPVKDYLDKELKPVEIASIEAEGCMPVYDITVESVHEFIANGIVVHNCTNPNIQQVPHAIEYRRCFRAPEGRKLVIADYSQIELRILADFTGDQGFIDAFNSGADLHRVTAAQVFSVPLEQVTKVQRDFAKRLNFGVVYGIGAQRFSMMTGLSLTEAEDILRRYFATYRQLDSWLRDAARQAIRERTAPRTVAGRLTRIRFDPEDRQAASLAQRNGKNSPIQGCLSAKTRVFEERAGYVTIKSLDGQQISVWDGSRFSKARVAYSGERQLVKVGFWGGHYIECSPEHKFLTIDVNGHSKWRTSQEFVKGNYVVLTEAIGGWSVSLRLPELHAGKAHNASQASLADAISDPFGLGIWLGRLASDGSLLSRQLYLLVAQHEEIILPQIRKFTEKFGHVYYSVRPGGRGTKPIHSLVISALGLVKQLHEAGLKTRVPDFAWQDSKILAGYLRGMFDGDGTVNLDGATLTFGKGPHFYLEWAREIQQALLLFGIRSRINQCAQRINVCVLKRDMPLFCERIGFINPQKQEKALRVKDGTRHKNRIYGRAVRIKSVEFTDEWVEMYDVVDSETSKFMANGLVTHNSSADILKRALRLLHDGLQDTSAQIVNIVHDEIVVETDADQAQEIAKKVEDAMCAAGEEYVKKVPVKVETEVADEWVK